MNIIPLSIEYQNSLPVLNELIRRAVDGTVLPIFIDYQNQRVIIGAIAASTSNQGKLEVTGDIKIIGQSNGLLLPDSAGVTTKLCRVQALYDAPSNNFILTTNPIS